MKKQTYPKVVELLTDRRKGDPESIDTHEFLIRHEAAELTVSEMVWGFPMSITFQIEATSERWEEVRKSLSTFLPKTQMRILFTKGSINLPDKKVHIQCWEKEGKHHLSISMLRCDFIGDIKELWIPRFLFLLRPAGFSPRQYGTTLKRWLQSVGND